MKYLIIILLLPLLSIRAQNKYLTKYSNFGMSIKNDVFYYQRYDKDFIVEGNCKSYEDCKNEYPEQTLKSVLSASNYDWDSKNYNYTIRENNLKYIKANSLSDKKHYFKLLLKVTFEWNDMEYAIIKYHIRENDKMLPNCSILKRTDKRWFIIKPSGSLTQAYFMFNYLSVKSLDAIFTNKDIGIPLFDKQIEEVHSSGKLDFNKALNSTSNMDMTKKELEIILDPLLN